MARKLKQSVLDSMPYLADDTEEKNNNNKNNNERKLKQEVLDSMPYLQDKDDDIAPVKQETEKSGFLKKSSLWDDGYQFGDLSRTFTDTVTDASLNILGGLGNMAEGIVDLGLHGVSKVSDWVGADKFADDVKKVANRNFVNEGIDYLENDLTDIGKNSVFGDTSDSISQGLGQYAGIILTGGLGAKAGLAKAGLSALTTGTKFASSMGSGISEAYQGGATDGQAWGYGTMQGAIDAVTELLFGGLGKSVKALGLSRGISSLDDVFAKKLSSKISNLVVSNAVELGVKASAEGFEEVLAGLGSAVAKKLTYESDEKLGQLVKDENLLEQFIVGSVVGGIAQVGDVSQSTRLGQDYVTELTANEQKVIDKLHEKAIAEQEANGKKLTAKEKSKLYDNIVDQMEKGRIGVDDIESVLGGESYTSFRDARKAFFDSETLSEYKKAIAEEEALAKEIEELGKKEGATPADNFKYNELMQKQKDMQATSKRAELKAQLDAEAKRLGEMRTNLTKEMLNKFSKDSKLVESYKEEARSHQKFKADPSKYKGEYARKTIQALMDSELANDTNEFHEIADWLAQMAEDRGVVFNLTENERLKGTRFEYKGKTTNAYLTDDGNVVLNIDSRKTLNSSVGHELAHVLEGTDLYADLQQSIKKWANSKNGEWDTRYKNTVDLYAKRDDNGNIIRDENGNVVFIKKNVNIDNEVTADLIGDYLFTDKDFVKHLSVNHQNAFMHIWDELKYMVKIAKAGSTIEKELLAVKKQFEEVWRETGKYQPKTDKAAENAKANAESENVDIAEATETDTEAPSTALDKAVADYVENEIDTIKSDIASFKEASFFAGKRKASVRQLSDGKYESSVEATQRNGAFAPNDNIMRTDSLEEALEAQYRYMLENGGEEGSRMIQKHADKYDEMHGQADDTIYSLTANADKELHKALYDMNYQGEIRLRDVTPSIMTSQKGVKNLPMTMNISHTRENVFTEAEAQKLGLIVDEHTHYHGLGEKFFLQVIDGLDNVTEAYRGTKNAEDSSRREDYFLLISEFKDKDGNTINVPVYINEHALYNRAFIDVNKISTVFGREGFRDYINKQIRDKNLVKIKNRSVQAGESKALIAEDYGMNASDSSISQNSEKSSENEKFSTESKETDATFSLSEAVEETKDLVAIHNMKSDELIKTLELGGLPMPSIAIIKAQQGHEKYGDVSLIFPRDTIDPQTSKDNKVYGGDAWTPTYPRIEYKANDAVQNKIKDKYYELAEKYGYDAVRPLYRYAHELESALNSEQGEANLLDWLYKDTKLMQVYLEDSGKGKVEDIIKETRTEASESDKQMNQWFIDKLGEDVVRAFKTPKGESPITYKKNFIAEHKADIASAWESFCRDVYQITEEQVQNVMRDTNDAMYAKFMKNAEQYLNNGGISIKTETDYDATERAIEEKAADGYKEWVDNLFKGAEEKTGIRNDKDAYTNRGDRRSWDALHWENTLENVVKAMKTQDQTGADAFSPASAIFAVAHKRYNSVDEIKADSDRLGRVSEDEYKAMESEYASRLAKIAESIKDTNERNPFIANDEAAQLIVDAVRNYKTKTSMLRYMQQYNSRVTESTVDDILSLVSDIANMPTGYFEAKPQRAVKLEEVGVFVIPNNADVKLKQELLNKGYSIAEYDPNIEGDRQRVVNQFEELKFSLSDASEQSSSNYGDFAVYGKDIKYTPSDIAPIAESIADDKVEADDDEIGLGNIAPLPDDELDYGTESAAIRPKRENQPSLKKIDKAEPHIAQVLTEEPKAEKKKTNWLSKFRTNFIDKGSAVEDLSLKTKNRALQDKYKAIGRAEAKAQYLMENGAEGVKSLNDIRTEIEKSGRTKEIYEYLYHKHNISRMSLESKEAPNLMRLTEKMRELKLLDLKENQLKAIASEKITEETSPKRAELVETVREYLASKDVKNKPVFDYSVTAENSQDIVNQLEATHPEYKNIASDIYGYMNHLRTMMVEGGIISQETANLWEEMYPYFVPIRRDGYDGDSVDVPLDTRRTGVNAPIKSATGGNRDILPLLDTMALRTLQTFKAIDKNRFGIELKNTLGSEAVTTSTSLDEAIDSIDTHEDLLQEGKNGRNPTFTVFENGERVTFDITKELYEAMKPASEGLSYTFKPLHEASKWHKKVLTEYNLFFTARNAIKDIQDVLINSQHTAKTYANFPQAFGELLTGKGKYVTEYWANGGKQNTYFDRNTNEFAKEKSTFRKVVGFPFDAISKVNDFVEAIPRLAEYIASRKSGATVDAAMLDAARVTTDFSAGGDVGKFFNRNGATFLNASIQGAAQQVRNVREAKAKGFKGIMALVGKCATAGLPALLFNSLFWDDDEEYEELSDYVKDNYYVVAKYGDGQFVRIPKGRTVSVIQELFEQIGNTATGEESDWYNVFTLAASNLAPNNPIDNNVAAPLIQAFVTGKTWYGEDLVPTRLQDVPEREQYDETIDSISKWLGENTGVSPYKINYVLNQYSGFVGDMFLPMLTPEAERGDSSLVGNMIAPLKDQFTVDGAMKNQNISDFYTKADELTVNANSIKATDEDILKNKYMSAVNTEIGKLYAEKREVQNSSIMSDKVKYRRVRELQKQINELAKESLNTYENVSIDGNYATVGDQHFRWYEPSATSSQEAGWKKISGDQLAKQETFTKGTSLSPSQYWNVYEGLSDITADKDEYGKSINGSRKEKVLDYINNLDADYETKIILYKAEYPSDDTYNMDIINYLNQRGDLTYEDRVSILTELGFRVTADGQIYAD